MRRVVAVTAVLLCVAGGVVAAPAGGAPGPAAGWVVSRTGPGGAVLKGWFTGSAERETASAVLFALSGRGRDRGMDGRFTTAWINWGIDASPRVYGDLQPACPAACTNPVDNPVGYGFGSNGHALDGTVYVATTDMAKTSVTVSTPGWRVRPWRPSMRTVTSDRAGQVGVRALHTSVGTFSGAKTPGGRYGSIGWGHLPCEGSTGEGSAVFSGGRKRPWPLDCDGRLVAWSNTAGATTWRLAGEATGVSGAVNVLVVVDFPRES